MIPNVLLRHMVSSSTKMTRVNYTVSQKKNKQINCFCHNFVKFPPILIIFGKRMANSLKLYEMHSFSTSPHVILRHTTLFQPISPPSGPCNAP